MSTSRVTKTSPAKIYTWVPGTRFGRELDVTTIGQELDHLIEAHGQKLPAEKVVEAAQNPMSPLHRVFEWDDTEAARQYRITQAQHLLRSVQVTITTPEKKEVTVRLTVTRERPSQPGKHHYSTTEYALADPELRAEVLKQALREMAAFRRKYAELAELVPVFAIIDRLTKTKRRGR